MNKKILCILSLILILISMSVIYAEDINSTDNMPISNTLNVSGDTSDDIQKTIDGSNNNDVIELDGNYTVNSKITIKKSLTIQGSKNGAVLNANTGTVFEITADNVILKDLTIINAKEYAVYDLSFDKKQDLTIINCTFKNCDRYHAVYYTNYENQGTLTVIDSTFENNTGGALNFLGSVLNINNTKFLNNHINYAEITGGAISAYAKNAYILNSRFYNNYAEKGGAISVSDTNLRINNCNFTSNSAKKEGGAIHAEGYLENVKNEKIEWTVTITNSTFSSNTANTKDDTIYSLVYNADITNSTFNSTQKVCVRIGALKNTNNNLTNLEFSESLPATLSPASKTTSYNGDYVVNVKTEKIPFINIKVKIDISNKSTKKTYSTYYTSEEYENARFKLSNLKTGKYNVKIYLDSKLFKANPVTTTLTIKKAKTITTAKYKKSKKITVKVQDKIQNPVKNIKIKIKIYPGKKSKTLTAKTNKKGIATINAKTLKKGKHKLIITSNDKNYNVNKKTSIKVK